MALKLPDGRASTINLGIARQTAINNLLRFSIVGGEQDIIGIMKNKPKFNLEGQYERLINMDGLFSFVNKIGAIGFNTQIGLTRTWSRKIYTGGSYLEISLQARILDRFKDDGSLIVGQDVRSITRNLIGLCNPTSLFDKEVKQTVSTYEANKNTNTQNTYVVRQGEKIDTNKGFVDRTEEFLTGLGTGAVGKTPPRCRLKISNIFNMFGFFVKSVSFEYSHEQTKYGPIYSDVEIGLTQSEIRTAGEIRNAFGEEVKK